MAVLTFLLSCIHQLTVLKINQMPADLTQDESKKLLKTTMVELMKKKFQVLNIPCNKPEAAEFKKTVDLIEQEIAQYTHLVPAL